MEYSKTVGYHHHHRHCNQLIRLDIVDDDSMSLMMVVLFCSRVYNFVRVFIGRRIVGRAG